jgi:ABC-2 type transport system ATP-binding protein
MRPSRTVPTAAAAHRSEAPILHRVTDVWAPTLPALAVRGLVKHYGTQVAVDGLDLDVPTGSCFGLVGPNGSGKTTTLRMVCGLVRPDHGQIVVAGRDPVADPAGARAHLGVVLDPLALFERLSARETLRTLGEIRGLARPMIDERADELFQVLQLYDDADRPISGYSHGMRKKTALAAALLHRPDVLLLDEPFEGVDPVSAITMRGMLDRVRDGGGTIVLSSHVMDLVERLCDHVAVIHRGRIVASGPTDELRGGRRLEEAFVDVVGAEPVDDTALAWLA